jgi:hypothetical protein
MLTGDEMRNQQLHAPASGIRILKDNVGQTDPVPEGEQPSNETPEDDDGRVAVTQTEQLEASPGFRIGLHDTGVTHVELDPHGKYSQSMPQSEVEKPHIRIKTGVGAVVTTESVPKLGIVQKAELEQLILEHVSRSIMSRENIQNILDSRNRIKLIKALDADYMNETLYKKFAQSIEKREDIQTDVRQVMRAYE